MRILHTSDIHLGRILYGRRRYEEFEAFLDWLATTVEEREVDALLIAGDIFDTATASNRSQEMYFAFLGRVARSACRHVVIIAGNHDSPTFLRAPTAVLRALDVHVVSEASPQAPQDEVIVLRDAAGNAELVVGAVPYLRDRDIRTVEAGESVDDKQSKLLKGIADHYSAVIDAAVQTRAQHGEELPIVMMGHLFTAGGAEGEGVRDLYVGSLVHVGAGIFGDEVDYVALGHLHVPQKVGGSQTRRYSGSPLPMGFGEARQTKSVCLVDFDGREVDVELVPVPVFQQLAQIQGDWAAIGDRIAELAATGESVWLEVIYDGEEVIGDLRNRLDEATDGTQLEVLRVKDARVHQQAIEQQHAGESLDDLGPDEVFARLLDTQEVPEEQRADLWHTYHLAVAGLHDDVRAE
jgi:DNA repair protein SbcD/Mre11